MLISLHLPKTAGASFYASLAEHYDGQVLMDYADIPINTAPRQRNAHALMQCALNTFRDYSEYGCIHGHFLPVKYLFYSRTRRNVRFITWIRDPIERLASHYYYWLRSYDPESAPRLHKRVVEEKWSLERFCLSTELRDFYSQFLWKFPLERFDFIGITEDYDTEFEYFSRNFLGHSLKARHINANPREEITSYFVDDPSLKEKATRYHSQDVELYKKALNIRLTRRAPDGEASVHV